MFLEPLQATMLEQENIQTLKRMSASLAGLNLTGLSSEAGSDQQEQTNSWARCQVSRVILENHFFVFSYL